MGHTGGGFLVVLFSFSLIMLASTVHGRKDPGEYWGDIMEGQPVVKATNQGHVEDNRDKGNTNDGPVGVKSVKNFDPRPNISIYHDGDVTTNKVKSTDADCNTHHDGSMSRKTFANNFEPRPNISGYKE